MPHTWGAEPGCWVLGVGDGHTVAPKRVAARRSDRKAYGGAWVRFENEEAEVSLGIVTNTHNFIRAELRQYL